jgi:GH24 family phage-related lysozyme (muramidase)
MSKHYRKAAELIIGFEGFKATPYGDVNNYRIGFGSSTYMLALNSAPLVLPPFNPKRDARSLKEPKINIQQAAYDLRRRLVEFEKGVRSLLNKQSPGLYEKLSDEAKAALLSIAYNFGSIIRPYGVPLPQLIKANPSNAGVAAAIRQIRDKTPPTQLSRILRSEQEAKYVEGTFRPTLLGLDYTIFDNMTNLTETPASPTTAGRAGTEQMSPYIASYQSFHPKIQYELTRRKFSTETVDAYMPFVNLTSLLYVKRSDTVETLSQQDNTSDSVYGWCPSIGIHSQRSIRFEQIYQPTVNVSQLQNRSIVGSLTINDRTKPFRSPSLLAASTDIEPSNIPTPGITSVNVERTLAGPMGVRGGLIRANLKLVAYSKGQVDTLLKYFLRPGTNLVLELGRLSTQGTKIRTFNWSRSLDEIKKDLDGIVQLRDAALQEKLIREYVYENYGNYEIFIGYTVKFNIKYTKENTYEIELSMNSVQQFEIPNVHTGVKSICASPTTKCGVMDVREYFSPLYAWKEKTFSRLLKSATTKNGRLYDDWNKHVVPIKNNDPSAPTTAGIESGYFITWKFFIDKVLNDENLGLLSIFPLATRNTIKAGLLSPSTTKGEIVKNNEKLIINEVNYHPDLRSTDQNVMIIINKQAQAQEDVQNQFQFSEGVFRANNQNYEGDISSPLEKRLLEELDMDDFAPAEQALRTVSGVSSLLRGVWLNTNAIIAAFDRTDTVSSALDALLVEMNRATEGYWNLQLLSSDNSAFPGVHVIDMGLSKTIPINKPSLETRALLLTSVTGPLANKDNILKLEFGDGDTPRYIYVFNEKNKLLSNGDSVASELLDVNINFDLPLVLATQVIAGVGGPAQKGTIQGVINVDELESLKMFPSISNICADSEPNNTVCVFDPLVDFNLRIKAIDANYEAQRTRIENDETLSTSGSGFFLTSKERRLKELNENTQQMKADLYASVSRLPSFQNQFADLGDLGSVIKYVEINPGNMVKKLNQDSVTEVENEAGASPTKKRPISHAWNSSNLTKVLIDLTLPGIGGVQLWQTFLVDKIPTVLEQGYYVVTKIVHEFTPQNGWITKIQGRFRYKPEEE